MSNNNLHCVLKQKIPTPTPSSVPQEPTPQLTFITSIGNTYTNVLSIFSSNFFLQSQSYILANLITVHIPCKHRNHELLQLAYQQPQCFFYSFFTAVISTSILSHTIRFKYLCSEIGCRNSFVTYLCIFCIYRV